MKDVVLLANPKDPSWEFAKKIQNYIHKTKEERVPLYEINICFLIIMNLIFQYQKI